MNANDFSVDGLSDEKKKLYWRSIKRGMKEMDLIFGTFARAYLRDMDEQETKEFKNILHCYDQDILEWITNKKPIPSEINCPMMQKIKNFSPSQFMEF